MKVEIFICSWVFSHLLIVVRSGTVQNTIKCYQCEIEGKNPDHTCTPDELKVCPNNYAADRCLTHIKRNGTHYHITKKCALAPCELPQIQSSLLKSASCDQTREEFSCYKCCDSDGCNLHNSAPGIHHHQPLSSPSRITFLFAIPLIFSFLFSPIK